MERGRKTHRQGLGATAVLLGLLLLPGKGSAAPAGPAPAPGSPAPDWAVTVFYGILSESIMNELIRFRGSFDTDYGLVIVGVSRRLAGNPGWYDVEAEGQVGKWVAGQDHWEVNGLVGFRWLAFPWDRVLDTSWAVGLGLSLASEPPPAERYEDGSNAQLLTYVQTELELGLPALPAWKLVTRIHHRSGMFRTFGNMKEASNALCFGIRRRF